MRATVNKSIVLPVLSRIQGITNRKTNLAITTNVILTASAGGMTISATDLETGYVGLYPAKVEAPGSIAISSRKLFEIFRDYPFEEILLNEIENHWIEIGSKNVEYHIVGMNPEEFPAIPNIEGADLFEIDSSVLAAMIARSVVISAAADDRRAHIVGVHVERAEEDGRRIFRMVSTDGSRLSKTDHVFEPGQHLPEFKNALIPKKALAEAAKFMDSGEVIRLGFKDSNMIVKKDNETLVIRLLEGEFPKYRDIVMKPEGSQVVLDRAMFLMTLKRMSILSSEDYKGVIFNFSENLLTISSTNPELGESKEEIPIEFGAKPINVMFNPRFFIDTLNVVDEDKVVLNIHSAERPCLIEAERNKNYISVIMPMRI
jgi:DNA polymerase-3 subunit beta